MKSRKIFITLFAATLISTLLGTVNVANNNSNKTVAATQINNKKHYVLQDAPKLSKWGYILNVNSSAQPIFVGKANYEKLLNNPYFKETKTVNPRKIKHVKFKVIKTMVFKDVNGTPEYLVTSKKHKYSTWTPAAGLQYYAVGTKSLQKVIKPLKRIASRNLKKSLNKKAPLKGVITSRKWISKNEHDYALAVKAAKKIKGNQRKFVLESLKQMKQDGNLHNIMMQNQNNILLWTIN